MFWHEKIQCRSRGRIKAAGDHRFDSCVVLHIRIWIVDRWTARKTCALDIRSVTYANLNWTSIFRVERGRWCRKCDSIMCARGHTIVVLLE